MQSDRIWLRLHNKGRTVMCQVNTVYVHKTGRSKFKLFHLNNSWFTNTLHISHGRWWDQELFLCVCCCCLELKGWALTAPAWLLFLRIGAVAFSLRSISDRSFVRNYYHFGSVPIMTYAFVDYGLICCESDLKTSLDYVLVLCDTQNKHVHRRVPSRPSVCSSLKCLPSKCVVATRYQRLQMECELCTIRCPWQLCPNS